MFTHFFIDRPILSAVISILIVLAGAVAMSVSPIEQYPDMAPPQVTIDARYPGATAEVIANNVAAPIEAQLNGLDNLLYFYSTSSSSGNVQIVVVFNQGSDPDINQVNVQNRLSQAMPQLPQVVVEQGITVDKKSPSIMMVVSVYSPDERYDAAYIANYTNLYVLDELKRVPGANRAKTFGLPDIAMRVWLRPDRMAQLGITVSEVSNAIQSQNQTFGIGQLGASPMPPSVEQQYVVTAQGLLTKPEEFENIIVRTAKEGAAIVRIKDIGRVELSQRDYSMPSRMNGKTATTIGVYQQPGANAVETAKGVREKMEELKAKFPTGLDYKIVLDTSQFTLYSIDKVVHTFFEAVVLVVLVVFVFLQSLRATVIPILAVPVSIVGTFVGMYLFGFSINMLTMFGMILAIGLVVDDAIVVVENVEVNITKKGLAPLAAAKEAMTEIAGALISIVLVLLAVFLPVAFLGGVTGLLYKQFAITIAISMVISGIMALTLSPALAAIIIKAHHGKKNRFFQGFENAFGSLQKGFLGRVARVIQLWPVSLIMFGAVVIGILAMFRILPASFVPDEDQGYFFVLAQVSDAASLNVTSRFSQELEQIVLQDPAVQDVGTINGFSFVDSQQNNSAILMFGLLKPFEERKDASLLSFDTLKRLNAQFAVLKDGKAFAVNPPSIPGLGTTGGFEFYILNRGSGDPRATDAALKAFLAKARERKELQTVNTTFSANSQQLFVDLDRNKAEVLGVHVADVFNTMQAYFGSQVAGQFSLFSRVWFVIIQADADYRAKPEDFSKVFVRSSSGANVPLSALITTRYVVSPKLMTRFNAFPAVKITGSQAPGYSSGDAIRVMEEVAHETLPGDFAYSWAGQALQEKGAGGTSSSAFIFGLIVVFLLLAAQFEKWTLPIAVVLTVPFAVLGALLLTWLLGLENDVYFQVGLVTLVGLSAKNAILICEFAIERVRHGMPAREAAIEAAGLRLRAIVMTSFAFILGCVPLAIATGPGANSLRAIGTGVIGGMLASTLIAIFFVPLFFWLLESMSAKFASKKEISDGQDDKDENVLVPVPAPAHVSEERSSAKREDK
ncbi:efflux RND transporter permease subunit [Nitrosomonas communis]|uniref:Efflux pump membrane transporter n=1 Tax=Nitrosomonas communis TaxID=44574 RepID=A0A1I4IXV3_9PROT|nr:multidrug efflux RND transporter permease subunit [Nitrosomonas communis]SFL59189.1 multidrug efflux pump [Nitrosomonas communis]